MQHTWINQLTGYYLRFARYVMKIISPNEFDDILDLRVPRSRPPVTTGVESLRPNVSKFVYMHLYI